MAAKTPSLVTISMEWKHLWGVAGVVGSLALAVLGGVWFVVSYNVDSVRHSLDSAQADLRGFRTETTAALNAINTTLVSLTAATARQDERTAAMTTAVNGLIATIQKQATIDPNGEILRLAGNLASIDRRLDQFLTRQSSFERVVMASLTCSGPTPALPSSPAAICTEEARSAALRAWYEAIR